MSRGSFLGEMYNRDSVPRAASSMAASHVALDAVLCGLSSSTSPILMTGVGISLSRTLSWCGGMGAETWIRWWSMSSFGASRSVGAMR